MQNSNECKRNFVAVYDGGSAVEDLKAKFCSTVANDVMLRTGLGVVRMWADEGSRGSRFQMLFTSFHERKPRPQGAPGRPRGRGSPFLPGEPGAGEFRGTLWGRVCTGAVALPGQSPVFAREAMSPVVGWALTKLMTLTQQLLREFECQP